jgi:hypothetical protein
MFSFSGSRDMVRRRSAVAAMLFAEALLLDRPFPRGASRPLP